MRYYNLSYNTIITSYNNKRVGLVSSLVALTTYIRVIGRYINKIRINLIVK